MYIHVALTQIHQFETNTMCKITLPNSFPEKLLINSSAKCYRVQLIVAQLMWIQWKNEYLKKNKQHLINYLVYSRTIAKWILKRYFTGDTSFNVRTIWRMTHYRISRFSNVSNIWSYSCGGIDRVGLNYQ